MAHGGTRDTGREESMADLVAFVDDLKLLRVSAKDYTGTRSSMENAQQQKIEKLGKENGTLNEVCFFIDQSYCKNCEMNENCYVRVI